MSHSQGWRGCDPLYRFSEKTAQKPEGLSGSPSYMLSGNKRSLLGA